MTDLTAPLPCRPEGSGVASDARLVPFDRGDPRWREPLVDLADWGLLTEAFYARRDGGNAPYHAPIEGAVAVVAARTSVAERLLRADRALAGHGVRLKVVDAYRPVATQRGLWRFFWDKLGRERPHLDEAGLEALVRTFVSDPRRFDPDDDTTWPIHST